MMRNIKLTLQYDGTDYQGWQTQKKGERTIQSVLEDTVFRLTGEKSSAIGSGRTDAGVHALSQVAAFKTESALPVQIIRKAMNALLPPDIRVLEASEADASFHPRYDAKGKSYFYLIANMEYAPPFAERYLWRVPRKLDVKLMEEVGKLLIGRQDFKAFMASGSSVKETVREIRSLAIAQTDSIDFLSASLSGRFIKISVEGDGFLRHMVRNIVGTLVEIGRGRSYDIPKVILSGDRRRSGPAAPAKGLFLERVIY